MSDVLRFSVIGNPQEASTNTIVYFCNALLIHAFQSYEIPFTGLSPVPFGNITHIGINPSI